MNLLRNVPYVYCAGFKICANIIVVGVLLNAVRYIEIAFYQPAFVASIISGTSWLNHIFCVYGYGERSILLLELYAY